MDLIELCIANFFGTLLGVTFICVIGVTISYAIRRRKHERELKAQKATDGYSETC